MLWMKNSHRHQINGTDKSNLFLHLKYRMVHKAVNLTRRIVVPSDNTDNLKLPKLKIIL